MLNLRNAALLCVLCFLSSPSARAQDDPNFEIGLKPFGSYQGGNIDTVVLSNGSLNMDIPLISYPQRGGKLKLDFALHYFNGLATVTQTCNPYVGCFGMAAGTEPRFAIIDKGAVAQPPARCGQTGATCDSTGILIVEANGTTHATGLTQSSILESVDATAYRVATGGSSDFPFVTITSSDGIVHQPASETCYWAFPGDYPGGYIPGSLTCAATRTDSNGNQITFSNTAGWTDTMGRNIPLAISSTNSSDFAGCTGPQPITSVLLWNPPGINGGTFPIKLCYVTLINPISNNNNNPTTATQMQSIVLPNGTAWTLQYSWYAVYGYLQGYPIDAFSTADISQVTFPTGGTLSYTWGTTGLCGYASSPSNMSVASRTLNPNDGTPAAMWNYSHSFGGSGYANTAITTVTDPMGNDSVHTFGLNANQAGVQNSCYPYEVQAQL